MKIFNTFFKAFSSYMGFILIHYFLLLAFRIWEWLYFPQGGSFREAWLGWAGDLLIINMVLLLLYLFYRALWAWKKIAARATMLLLTLLFYIFYAAVELYFISHQQIIDVRNLNCSSTEAFTMLFSNGSMPSLLMAAALVIVSGVGLYYFLFHRKHMAAPNWVSQIMIVVMVLSFAVVFELGLTTDFFSSTSQRINKAYLFSKTSIGCCLGLSTPINNELTGTALLQELSQNQHFTHPAQYPLLHTQQSEDCLSQYFKKQNPAAPDIVLLVIEGLGDEFLYPMHDITFMPFLSQMRKKSLYWSRHLSPVEEGVSPLPSLLAGLPLGQEQLSGLAQIPYHYTLVNVLKSNNYHTSFFYGQWAWDESNEKYLNQSQVDFIWDASDFGPQHEKVLIEEGNYHWGYNDRDLFAEYFNQSAQFPSGPRFDIIYSSSARAPFAIADKDRYESKFAAIVNKIEDNDLKEYLTLFGGYFRSLMFSNDALENFFTQYKNRENYNNTIFIVTGSYSMHELATPHPLRKYHVPLMVFSPMISKGVVFENISSHYDLYGTLLGFLSEQYELEIPQHSTSIGNTLCSSSGSGQKTLIPFLSPEGKSKNLLYNNYFLSDQTLYTQPNGLKITPLENEEQQTQMMHLSDAFHTVRESASVNLMPDSLYFSALDYQILLDTLMSKKRVRNDYLKIMDKKPIENIAHTIDITFTQPEVPLNEVFVVFELVNEKDQIVSWQNFGIPTEKNDFSFSIKMEEQEADSLLYMQLYIWNEAPLPYSFERLRTTLYARKNPLNNNP